MRPFCNTILASREGLRSNSHKTMTVLNDLAKGTLPRKSDSPRVITQIWRWTQDQGWSQDGPSLLKHKDWVRDVAWCPNLGLPNNTIASASQDKTVVLWCENLSTNSWEPVSLPEFQVISPGSHNCWLAAMTPPWTKLRVNIFWRTGKGGFIHLQVCLKR